MANNARIPDIETLLSAGIDPKTGLPIRMSGSDASALKDNIKRLLRVIDEQNAINRYTWYNLPDGLDGHLIERILYYKGQGMFFYMEATDNFFFLPYALDGTIDVYGRYNGVKPLPFNGVSEAKKDDGKAHQWLTTLTRKPVHEVLVEGPTKMSDLTDNCVLLSDYSKQISQNVIPRQILQDPLLDVMSDCIPFMRTAMLNSTGVMGMRVNSQDEQSNVEAASRSINNAALTGKKYIPVVGNIDFQEMTGGTVAKSEEFMLAMESLDNFRLAQYGLENGGLFQKKAHMLESEQQMNGGNVGLIYNDGLTNRQKFCDIVNSIWGLGISCEASECQINNDMNMDGQIADTQDQSGTMGGTQPDMGV